MAFKKFVKKAVKKVKRKVGQAVTKRYYGNKKLNVGQIVKDVAMVKRLMNVEKKRFNLQSSANPVGQVFGNIDGWYCVDITPAMAEGVGYAQRTGASIKMTGYHLTAQFVQQSGSLGRQNFKIFIYQVMGTPLAVGTIPTTLWNPNLFVGTGTQIVDYNSQLNPDQFGKFKLLQYKHVSIAPDSISGQTAFRTFSMGKKLNHHVRFNKDTTTVVNGQIIMVVLADSGNSSTSTVSSITNIPQTAVLTGATFNWNVNTYYVDN